MCQGNQSSRGYSQYSRTIVILVFAGIGLLIWHFFVASFLDLGADEAHYGLYALNIDIGYFDHPPLVGWLLSPLLLYKSDVIARIIPWLVMAVIHWLIYVQTYRISGNHYTSLVSIILFSFNPMVQLLWLGMVPDTPLMLMLMVLVLIVPVPNRISKQCLGGYIDFFDAKAQNSLSWRKASILGLVTGLAGLSKFTAIVIPISWLLDGRIKYWWRQLPFYWAVLCALLVVSPFVFFLWQSDFITFRYQADHVSGGRNQWYNLFVFPLVQCLAYGLPLMMYGAAAVFRYWHTLGWIRWYICLLFGAALYSSVKGNLLPHWTVSAYAVMSPYAALYIADHVLSIRSASRICTGIMVINVAVVLLWAVLMGLVAFGSFSFVTPVQREVRGWQSLARWSTEVKRDSQADAIWLKNWSHVSRIAWYVYPEKVVSLDMKNKQFGWWYGTPEQDRNGLLILFEGEQIPAGPVCRHIADWRDRFRQAGGYLCSYSMDVFDTQ